MELMELMELIEEVVGCVDVDLKVSVVLDVFNEDEDICLLVEEWFDDT